jgi:hypothetical protein
LTIEKENAVPVALRASTFEAGFAEEGTETGVFFFKKRLKK